MATELPKHLQDIKDYVFVEKEAPTHTHGITDVDAFYGMDNSWSIAKAMKDLEIDIKEIDEDNNSMIFDMIGIDTSLANAFRRILLAEVPTMAIEDCCVLQNNSILQDEVLCHRLGLVPIACDPRLFDFVDESQSRYLRGQDPSNTLVFKLHIECKNNPKAKDKDPTHKKYINSIVRSSDIEWIPQPGQLELLQKHGHPPIKMVYDDIIIAKLRPGQCIEISMRAVKGIGRDHAKYSAVGTAFYRLLPHIEFDWNEELGRQKHKIKPQDAEYLRDLCPKKVFDVEDSNQIVIARARDCTMCRACIMDDNVNKMFGKSYKDTQDNTQYEQFVKLRKKRDHFIFTIENIGQYPDVAELFKEAIKVLKLKCQKLIDGVYAMQRREDEEINIDQEMNDGQQEEEEEQYEDGDDRMQDID
eukprot:508176_1